MKIYILKRIRPDYDETNALVIAAHDEKEARAIAAFERMDYKWDEANAKATVANIRKPGMIFESILEA